MNGRTDTLEQYRLTRRRREKEVHRAQRQRRARMWTAARHAAAWLKQAGASRVVLFGSVANDEHLSPRSDVDLAAGGLEPQTYFRAVAQLQDLAPGLSFDLIQMEQCPRRCATALLRRG